MNIKGKILNLLGYFVFMQNEAGRCENWDIGKAKSTTDDINPHKIIFPIFPTFFQIFRLAHAPPRARASGLEWRPARDQHASVVFSGDGLAGDFGKLHHWKALLQSINIDPLWARKEVGKTSDLSAKHSDQPSASNSDELWNPLKLAPLLAKFSRYHPQAMGNKSPMVLALNWFEKPLDLKLKVLHFLAKPYPYL